ncbi:hypothetical protein GCM10010187_74300 [Actinomadura coerulea]|nr:hypothetical protein GCM10010187_74300 [Actinomadura coerulea]
MVFRPVDLPDPAPVELSPAWRRGNDDPALACCCATCDHLRRLDGVRGLAYFGVQILAVKISARIPAILEER